MSLLDRLLMRKPRVSVFYQEHFVLIPDKHGRHPWIARVYSRDLRGPVETLDGFADSHDAALKAARKAAFAAVKRHEDK